MKVPFFDLKRQYLSLKSEIDSAVHEVFADATFSGGPYVEKFEEVFSRYCGVRHTTGVGSGTDALHLAMRVAGVGPGDEVILPANTFIATAWGVSYVGATPVFVDCEPATWNIDPEGIEQRITERTKAVIGVHLYGQPCDIDSIKRIAEKYNLKFIEDCAQAQGARYRGGRVGSFGDIGCFSFYPGKNLGAYGEAGGITTDNSSYDSVIRSLRNHGSREKYFHDTLGFNMRMDGIQGAVLRVKLKYLDKWNSRRREIAQRYRKGMVSPTFGIQHCPGWAESACHLFVVTVDGRDDFRRYLEGQGIQTLIHYPVPIHLQKAYAHLGYKKGAFPAAESLSDKCISLPMFPEMTDDEVDYVIEAVNAYSQ